MIRYRFFLLSRPALRCAALYAAPRNAGRRLAGRILVCVAAAFGAAAVLPVPVHAESVASQTLERRVKAAFLYKFLGYADFPAAAFADANAPITIGVVGSDEMVAELTQVVAGRQVRGRPVVVRAMREGELGNPVHLLFVAGSDNARTERILHAAAAGAATALLSVTECELGLQQGSVINFRIIDERVRFDVSLDSAEKNNVKLSSRLLTVANRVIKGNN